MSRRNPGLLERTLRRFRRAWPLGEGNRPALKDDLAPELPEDDLEYIRARIEACLEARGGEVSSRARAAELGEAYLVLDDTGRQRFLELLNVDYAVDPAAVDTAIAERQSAASHEAQRHAEQRLAKALVAPRVALLRQFNGLNEGVKFLVDLRADLKRFVYTNPNLKPLEEDLHRLLASWFDIGFLELARITWNTPAALLEKLIEYEAVHAILSWDDLKNRLEIDRRCYAFFHPNMPNEPLIFVQVALVDEMSDNIQALLDQDAPLGDAEEARAAIFYSISNCQSGLAGVSFGDFLIKRVANSLARELPNIKVFATLSPMPGFRRWIDKQLEAGTMDLGESELTALPETTEAGSACERLRTALETPDWWTIEHLAQGLRPVLTRLAAIYLVREKRGRRALNPVAHFHLTNGARVERLNWLGDISANGIEQSWGMMVNYRYLLADIEKHHEGYTSHARVSAAGPVSKLARQAVR